MQEKVPNLPSRDRSNGEDFQIIEKFVENRGISKENQPEAIRTSSRNEFRRSSVFSSGSKGWSSRDSRNLLTRASESESTKFSEFGAPSHQHEKKIKVMCTTTWK